MQDRIEKTVELNAPIARVWRALTDHREFGQWFRADLDGPFVLGGITRGRMTYPGHEQVPWECRIERMEHERLFSFSWPHEPDAALSDPATPRTLVEFTLEATASGTRLVIVESGFASLPEGMRMRALRDNESGWSEQSRNIQAHVEA